jgi:hypothetical protein
MDPDIYYRDHWVEIEPERLEAYEAELLIENGAHDEDVGPRRRRGNP